MTSLFDGVELSSFHGSHSANAAKSGLIHSSPISDSELKRTDAWCHQQPSGEYVIEPPGLYALVTAHDMVRLDRDQGHFLVHVRTISMGHDLDSTQSVEASTPQKASGIPYLWGVWHIHGMAREWAYP